MYNESDKKAEIPDSDGGPDKLREAEYWKIHGRSSSTPLSKSSATDVVTPTSTPVAAQRPHVAPRRPKLQPDAKANPDKTVSGVQPSSHTARQSQGDKNEHASEELATADSNSLKVEEKEKEVISDNVNTPARMSARPGTSILNTSITTDGVVASISGASPQNVDAQEQELAMLRLSSLSYEQQLALAMQMSRTESSSSATSSRSNTYSPAMFQSTPAIGQIAGGMEGSNGSGASTPESDAEQPLPIPVGDDADSHVEAGIGEKEKEKENEVDERSPRTPCP